MTDARPRPEYGEYATPDEQAAAMGVMREPVVEELPPPVVPAAPLAPVTRPRRWDLVITVGLIVLGAWSTIDGFTAFSDVPGFIAQLYSVYGYDGTFTATDQATTFGIVIRVLQPVVFVVVLSLSMRSLRAGRITFWIPLVGGVVALGTSVTLIMILLYGQPAFVEFMNSTITF